LLGARCSDVEWAWLIKVRDGKGIEVWTFTDRAQALEAAGLSE
jgi:ketosteroid isomerase-like protein